MDSHAANQRIMSCAESIEEREYSSEERMDGDVGRPEEK